MTSNGLIVLEVMRTTGTTQSELARWSGVHQPSISQLVTGKISASDEQVNRLLECMGHRLVVSRHSVPVELTRSERRSWVLHRAVARHLDRHSLERWRPRIERNLDRLATTTQGQPHLQNLERWQALVAAADVDAVRRVLTGTDRDSIEMREVSPMAGLLTPHERADALQLVH